MRCFYVAVLKHVVILNAVKDPCISFLLLLRTAQFIDINRFRPIVLVILTAAQRVH
jgi:hypothetical protein